MSKDVAETSRRRFIKITVTSLAATPFVNVLFSGSAEAVDMVSESDPTAVALKYRIDATKATERKDTTAFCSNCQLYTGKPSDANGPCTVLGGKLVSAKGWCTAWTKKQA